MTGDVRDDECVMTARRYLGAGQDVGVGLDPPNDLTQDDPVRKHIHLQRDESFQEDTH